MAEIRGSMLGASLTLFFLVLLKFVLQGDDQGSPTTLTLLPFLLAPGIAFGFSNIEPGRLEMVRVTLLTREEMPMQVRNLVTQPFIVDLSRLYDSVNSLGHLSHFVHDRMPLLGGEFEELSKVLFGSDNTISLIELPWAQKSNGFLEFPDEFPGKLLTGMVYFFAQRT